LADIERHGDSGTYTALYPAWPIARAIIGD